jgi:hypothetical protein
MKVVMSKKTGDIFVLWPGDLKDWHMLIKPDYTLILTMSKSAILKKYEILGDL